MCRFASCPRLSAKVHMHGKNKIHSMEHPDLTRFDLSSIKKACPLDSDNPVFAVKYIHKDYAARHGKISARQLQLEVTVHRHVSGHGNIISFYQTGEDEVWRWIAME